MDTIKDILASSLKAIEEKGHYQEAVRDTLAYPPVKTFIENHTDKVSSTMIENSLSKLHEFKREHQAALKGQGVSNPGFEPELYINGNYIDVRYQPTQAFLEAGEKRQQAALLSNASVSRDVRGASLDDFYLNSPQRCQLIEEIIHFTQQYLKSPHLAQGLYIHGPFGVGKTYLLGALANDLVAKKVSVQILHLPTFAMEIKNAIREQKTLEMIKTIQEVDVLIMDDIGAEFTTPWMRDEVVTTILEFRMKEALPTFFTSNFNMDQLQHHLAYSSNGVEQLKAQRIMERIRFLAKEVALDGPNMRQQSRQIVEEAKN